MAYAHDVPRVHGPSLLQRIGNGFVKWLEAVMEASQANRCRLEAERLELLSDDDLAKMGLRRDQIMLHAFQRFLYL